MKQYCRYCAHLCTGNGIWCDERKVELRESTAKSLNSCKLFSFCEEDAFFETDGYKPRQKRRGGAKEDKLTENQISMQEVSDG